MTKLNPDPDHPLTRETDSCDRGKTIIVEIHPRFVELRLKGRRRTTSAVSVDYLTLYRIGWKMRLRDQPKPRRRAR